ncbi:coagulation factor X-like [Paramacrobiotus metropolitanus]|uniref:coagulation factor X-like n=1 Tax=Paramacrobiotus metropolitanus TaxID=2943436 RepID=UPI00244649AB|nr:coagulation factor X-like [Paramacrobiotus metropolitanus]
MTFPRLAKVNIFFSAFRKYTDYKCQPSSMHTHFLPYYIPVAIGNDCESDSCCSKYVEHSHCNISEKLCACNKGYVFSPLSKLCQKIELVYHKQKSQPLITPVAGNFHQLKTFCNDTFCVDTTPHFHPTTLGQGGKARSVLSNQCFLMYFPCLVQNSVCTPHPSNPYQGYCACQAGYTADGEDACVPDKGDTVGLIPPDTEESAVQSTTAETEITTVSPTESGTTAEETTSTTSSDSFETSTEPAHVNPFPDKVSCGRPGTTKSSEFGLSSYFSVRTKKSVDSDSLHRIVGGQDALQNEICWQAGVISFASDMQSYEYCGGTILSERWVLTAMHCVVENTDVAQPTPISRIFVSIGATNFPASALSTGSVCGSYLKVQEVIIHPTAAFIQDETDQFVGISDDLALIKLEGTLNFSLPCICPLCLTPKRPKPEETCIVSGYGCQDAACESPPPHSLAWLKVSTA